MITENNGGGSLISEVGGTMARTTLKCPLLLTVENIYGGIQVLWNIV